MSEDADRAAFENYLGAQIMTKDVRARYFARRDGKYINQVPREVWGPWLAALEWERRVMKMRAGSVIPSFDKK